MGQPPQMGQPPPQMQAAPPQMQQQPQMQQMQQQPQMGQQVQQMQQPPQMGAPPQMGQPSPQLGAPPHMGAPPQAGVAVPQPVPFGGLQVDTPKANMQRRVYAADDRVPEQAAAVPPGQPRRLSQRPTTTTQPGAPQPRAQRSDSNRVDPAQIPRQDDAQVDAGQPWLTRTNLGQVPPPAASGFLVEDDGNANPRYMRLSLNQVVASEDHLKASAIPFGVVVQPLPQLVPSVVFAQCGS